MGILEDLSLKIGKNNLGRYNFESILGQGSSGTIYLVQDLENGQTLCCKTIPKETIGSGLEEKNIAVEVESLMKMNHPNIVKFHDFCVDSNFFYIFEEYCKGENLLSIINEKIMKGEFLEEESVKKIMRQILDAINYMHKNGVAHRDMKPENIIVENAKDGEFRLKIVDFGLAAFSTEKDLLSTFCGSIYYLPPEMLNSKSYVGSKVDVWSVGVILFVLLTNQLPFENDNIMEILKLITNSMFTIPEGVYLSDAAFRLINRMLDPNPETRITAEDALRSEYIAGVSPQTSFEHSMPNIPSISSMNNFEYDPFDCIPEKRKKPSGHKSKVVFKKNEELPTSIMIKQRRRSIDTKLVSSKATAFEVSQHNPARRSSEKMRIDKFRAPVLSRPKKLPRTFWPLKVYNPQLPQLNST